jgi:hypothetical protein
MRRPSTFKKTDIRRAMKAVFEAGLSVARIEIGKDGVIVIVPGKAPTDPAKISQAAEMVTTTEEP